MLKRYIEGLVTALLILGLMGAIWGFFGALILGLTWWVFWVSLAVVVLTSPAVYAFSAKGHR